MQVNGRTLRSIPSFALSLCTSARSFGSWATDLSSTAFSASSSKTLITSSLKTSAYDPCSLCHVLCSGVNWPPVLAVPVPIPTGASGPSCVLSDCSSTAALASSSASGLAVLKRSRSGLAASAPSAGPVSDRLGWNAPSLISPLARNKAPEESATVSETAPPLRSLCRGDFSNVRSDLARPFESECADSAFEPGTGALFQLDDPLEYPRRLLLRSREAVNSSPSSALMSPLLRRLAFSPAHPKKRALLEAPRLGLVERREPDPPRLRVSGFWESRLRMDMRRPEGTSFSGRIPLREGLKEGGFCRNGDGAGGARVSERERLPAAPRKICWSECSWFTKAAKTRSGSEYVTWSYLRQLLGSINVVVTWIMDGHSEVLSGTMK
jgi:hypothetical protein